MPSEDFLKQLRGYGLTTAHILYRLPDYRSILQTYVWQDYDVAPEFPELQGFLRFWQARIEGPLFCVTVTHARLIKPAELRFVGSEYRLH